MGLALATRAASAAAVAATIASVNSQTETPPNDGAQDSPRRTFLRRELTAAREYSWKYSVLLARFCAGMASPANQPASTLKISPSASRIYIEPVGLPVIATG